MLKCIHIYQLLNLNYFVYFSYVSLDECTVYQRKIENKHLKKLTHYIYKCTCGNFLLIKFSLFCLKKRSFSF